MNAELNLIRNKWLTWCVAEYEKRGGVGAWANIKEEEKLAELAFEHGRRAGLEEAAKDLLESVGIMAATKRGFNPQDWASKIRARLRGEEGQ